MFTQIDAPGSLTTVANGINDAGQIVGTKVVGSVTGDPHFTTYDGVHYDYQGVGDFLLTRSTVADDQFHIEIRTRSLYSGGAATIISEAAASVCNHDLTFDIDRASTGTGLVCLDGTPIALSAANPVISLGACEISELSSEHYKVVWDTGEILDLTSNGTYLDLLTWLSPIDGLSAIEGLLGSDRDPDIWRVTGAASLFDPVPEPGTLTLLSVGIVLTGLVAARRQATPRRPGRRP